jgi:ribosome-binding factor A
MASIRQNKVGKLIQRELATIFQRETRTFCGGALVSVTIVRVTPDLGVARGYLSIFGVKDKEEIIKKINGHSGEIRYQLAAKLKHQLRRTPELEFFIDDSLDYAENIDDLLKS